MQGADDAELQLRLLVEHTIDREFGQVAPEAPFEERVVAMVRASCQRHAELVSLTLAASSSPAISRILALAGCVVAMALQLLWLYDCAVYDERGGRWQAG